MFSKGAKNRWLIIGSVLLMSVGFILFQNYIDLRENFIDNGLAMVFRPFESFLCRSGKGLQDVWRMLCNVSVINKENESLREKNAKLSAELEQIKILRDENVALRRLLDLKIDMKGEGIAAEIIGRDATNWFERFVINEGKSKGISKKMIVQKSEGLVGQITILNNDTATIRTILNPRSAIPVYVVESGTYGVLYGDGSPICTMKFIRNITFLQEGHLVVTSGMGDIFPSGILVGRIINVHGSVDSLSTQAKVKPFVNFENLRYVIVTRGKN